MIESAWSVWVHPRRAFGEITELRRERDDLRRELEELQKNRLALKEDLLHSAQLQTELEQLRSSLEKEVERLKEINTEQAERLEDWEKAGEEMERVAVQLEKMVAMRERMNTMRREYEAKISKLEGQLWNSHNNRGPQYARSDIEIADASESELLGPGEVPLSPPIPIRLTPRRPKINPPADDSDWLLSLPE